MTGRTSDDRNRRSTRPPTPINARKRADQVRDKLVQLIREGYLGDGQKLPTEPQLSAMFGVGRSTVREAVQSLIGLGIVEMRPGRGAYVRRLSVHDIVRMVDGAVRLEYGAALQLHEARAMIEITAARLAATRHTEADLRAMTDALLRYRIADHAGNPDALTDADVAFHTAIVGATHNEVLVSLFASIAGIPREPRRQDGATREADSQPLAIAEHEAVHAAIAAADPLAAAKRMQRHMRTVWRLIERLATPEGDSTLAGQAYLPMHDEDDGG